MGHFNRYQFEDFVTDTRQVTADSDLFALLKRAVAQHGYDRISLWVIDDPDLPQRVHGRGVLHNFPDDVRGYYQDNGCAAYDPVMMAVRRQSSVLDWESYEKRTNYLPAQTKLYNVAREGGLRNGLTAPIWGQTGLVASISLASTEGKDGAHANPDLIGALTAQFYLSYKRLNAQGETPRAQVIGITQKQTEILSWVAAGKTDNEIAAILGISRNTVDTHMRQIFARLDAPNRVTAVVKAISEGLIRP